MKKSDNQSAINSVMCGYYSMHQKNYRAVLFLETAIIVQYICRFWQPRRYVLFKQTFAYILFGYILFHFVPFRLVSARSIIVRAEKGKGHSHKNKRMPYSEYLRCRILVHHLKGLTAAAIADALFDEGLRATHQGIAKFLGRVEKTTLRGGQRVADLPASRHKCWHWSKRR